MSGMLSCRLPPAVCRLEEIADVMAVELHAGDGRIQLCRGIADDVVRVFAGERNDEAFAGDLHVEPGTTQPGDERRRVIVEFESQELRALGEFRDGARVLE